jgi:hypothetical protein
LISKGEKMNMITKIRSTFLSVVIMLVISFPVLAFAQETLEENVEDFGEKMEVWGERMEAWGENLEESIEHGDIESPPPLPFGDNWDKYYNGNPKFNAYIDDMDFEDAYHNHYPYCYGVYVSDVIKGGNFDNAGIRGGDIIMEFDGEKVRFEDHLLQLRDSKNIGDSIIVKLFRNENELETELVFAEPKSEEDDDYDVPEFEDMRSERPHPGFGGGGPELILLEADLGAINDLLVVNGFDEIDDQYIPLFGGYGMGNVGNGWFIGGAGYGYEIKEKTSFKDGERRYRLSLGFGGMTVNKKHALTNNLVLDLGMLIGGGGAEIEIRQRDGEYAWNTSFDDEQDLSSLKYRKGYFVFRPSIGVLVRILPWMGIHGSVGYNGSYAFNDEWKEDYFNYPVGGESPKPLDGLSYSINIWFGH